MLMKWGKKKIRFQAKFLFVCFLTGIFLVVCFSLTTEPSKEWTRHKGIGEGFADRSILIFSLSTHLCCRDPDWLQSLALCPVFWQETFICPTSHSWRWIPTTCIWWQCSLKQLWICASTPAVVTLLFTKILWELGENRGCPERLARGPRWHHGCALQVTASTEDRTKTPPPPAVLQKIGAVLPSARGVVFVCWISQCLCPLKNNSGYCQYKAELVRPVNLKWQWGYAR